MSICLFCGDEELLALLEYWPETGEFTLDTCCEGLQESIVSDVQMMSRRERASWFAELSGYSPRTISTDNPDTGTFCVDLGLELSPVKWQEAKDFVALHHRHNGAPVGWRFGQGLRSLNTGELVGVVTAGRPLARNLDPKRWIEVTRLCVKELHPHSLSWNACSMLYGFVFREAKKRGFRSVISYTHLHESGASLIAAGFTYAGLTSGGSWSVRSRPRPNAPKPSKKRRWVVEDLHNRSADTRPQQIPLPLAA